MAAVLGSGIVFLDSTVVTVALPAMGAELPSALFGVYEAQSYIYNAYLLTLSALLVLAGVLADARGRKRMFILGLVGFGVTSVLCGLAPTMELLIIGRALQGAAGALLVPGSLAILTAAFSGEARGRAMGVWAGASGATAILGPLVGGTLVDAVSWRAVFLINVPLIALAWWTTARYVAESRDPAAPEAIDWWGAGLVVLGVGGLTFGLIRGQERQWDDPLAWVALAIGLVASAMAAVRVRSGRSSLIPVSLFRSRVFNTINLSTFLIYGALYVVFYILTLYLQGTVGYTATAAGFAGLPSTILLTLLSARVGGLSERRGPRMFLIVGPLVMAGGVLLLARVPPSSSAWLLEATSSSTWLPPVAYLRDVLPGILLFGAGLTLLVAPLTSTLMGSVPEVNAGVASAFNNAISRVGPQLCGALLFVAVTAVFYGSLAAEVPGLDTTSPELRSQVAPLNPPGPDAPADAAAAAGPASGAAFATAMLGSAALLVVGAGINATGLAPGRATT